MVDEDAYLLRSIQTLADFVLGVHPAVGRVILSYRVLYVDSGAAC